MFKKASKDKNDLLITLTDPYSFTSEQFKKLRTKIAHAQNGNVPKTILVTSAVQEDGKSTIAANLAITISQGLSEHVLLVDCDLRAPSIHTLFKIDDTKGLSDYLRCEGDISNFISKTDVDKLSILPAGKAVDNPAELIASDKMSRLIQEMKSQYNNRYIIIDCTPVMPTTEPTIVANLVDTVIFVVRADMTSRDMVEKSIKSIKREKIMGIVFNDVKETPVNKYYYRYYYTYRKKKT